MPFRFVLPILALTVSDGRAEPVQSYDSYRSWLVACDNTLGCVAKGFADESATRAELRIERAAGPDDALIATMEAETKVLLDGIAVDGVSTGLAADDWKIEAGDGSTTITSDRPEAVRSLVKRLRDGATLTFGGNAEVPLDGFTAALLRIDERQGRIGGVTALVRTGPAPASRVPPAPPVPLVPNHPVEATLAPAEAERLTKDVRSSQTGVIEGECQVDDETPEAFALDASRALVLVPCLMGAYQGSSLAFVASRADGAAQRLVAQAPYRGGEPDQQTVDLFTEAGFDPETGLLTMFAKGRGLADCGMAASWIWNGTAFDLASLSLQQSCGGAEPGAWPTLFRSVQ